MIKKTLEIANRRGPGFLLKAAWRKIYFRHDSIWVVQNLANSPTISSPTPDLRIEFDRPERVLEWLARRDEPGSNDLEEIAHMKKSGHIFAGCYFGDELIGYRKMGWDKVYVLDYRTELQLPAGAYFGIAGYIRENYRHKGLGTYLICATNAEMKKRGFKWRLAHIRADNKVMLKTSENIGSQAIGRVIYRRLCGRESFSRHPQKIIDDYFSVSEGQQ